MATEDAQAVSALSLLWSRVEAAGPFAFSVQRSQRCCWARAGQPREDWTLAPICLPAWPLWPCAPTPILDVTVFSTLHLLL